MASIMRKLIWAALALVLAMPTTAGALTEEEIAEAAKVAYEECRDDLVHDQNEWERQEDLVLEYELMCFNKERFYTTTCVALDESKLEVGPITQEQCLSPFFNPSWWDAIRLLYDGDIEFDITMIDTIANSSLDTSLHFMFGAYVLDNMRHNMLPIDNLVNREVEHRFEDSFERSGTFEYLDTDHWRVPSYYLYRAKRVLIDAAVLQNSDSPVPLGLFNTQNYSSPELSIARVIRLVRWAFAFRSYAGEFLIQERINNG